MTNIYSWLLKAIFKNQSIQGESSFLHKSYFWSICLNDVCARHNDHKGEDKNIDLLHGQHDHNVGI